MNGHAARVASFSLYLAMCDEIDPRRYWTGVRFPPLRGHRIVEDDFFAEGRAGFDTVRDADRYDIVIGNAPWGKNTVTDHARRWAKKSEWPINNLDVGTLFLAKGLALAKPGGHVAMIQPAARYFYIDAAALGQFASAYLRGESRRNRQLHNLAVSLVSYCIVPSMQHYVAKRITRRLTSNLHLPKARSLR